MKNKKTIMACMISIMLITNITLNSVTTVSAISGIAGESADNPVTTTGELTAAFAAAQDGDTVYIGPYTIIMDSSVTMTKAITVKGASKINTVLKSPAAGGRHFIIASNVPVIFEDMTLQGSGKSLAVAGIENGGIVCNANMLQKIIINNCIMKDNINKFASGNSSYGGAVSTLGAGSVLEMSECTVIDNSSGAGGALLFFGIAALTDCVLTGNSTNGNGGAIFAFEDIVMTDCTLNNNSTNVNGGGVYAYKKATLTNCTVNGNSTTGTGGSGGGIFANTTALITNCAITNNISKNHGGGAHIVSGATLINCTISKNTATESGGGLRGYNASTNITTVNCTISGNVAKNGGGIYTSGSIEVYGCIVAGNYITDGSASEIFMAGDWPVQAPTAANHYSIIGVASGSLSDIIETESKYIGGVGSSLIGKLSNGVIMPLENSIAKDGVLDTSGWPVVPANDQRGISRPQGAKLDIGAVELLSQKVLITGIVINEGSITLNIGGTTKYTATVSPPNYTTTNPVTWHSSDESVATIDQNGVVTAIKSGNTNITCQIIDGDNNDKVWTSNAVTVTVNAVTAPILANPDLNKIILTSDTILGKPFTFTAIGDRQNATGVTAGDEKYIPITWHVNPSGEFTEGEPYDASATIEKPGSYKLSVQFMLKRFDGNEWVDTGTIDTKTLDIRIDPIEETPETGETPKSKEVPKTGDAFPGLVILTLIGSIFALTTLSIYKKRSSQD